MIIGVGLTRLGRHHKGATILMQESLQMALGDARLSLDNVKGLIAVPSLSEPRFKKDYTLMFNIP